MLEWIEDNKKHLNKIIDDLDYIAKRRWDIKYPPNQGDIFGLLSTLEGPCLVPSVFSSV
jgi:hypothetical protein